MEHIVKFKEDVLPKIVYSFATLTVTTVLSLALIWFIVPQDNLPNVNWASAFVGSIFGQITILFALAYFKYERKRKALQIHKPLEEIEDVEKDKEKIDPQDIH